MGQCVGEAIEELLPDKSALTENKSMILKTRRVIQPNRDFRCVLNLLPGLGNFYSVETSELQSEPALLRGGVGRGGWSNHQLILVSGLLGKGQMSVLPPAAVAEMSPSLCVLKCCWYTYVGIWGQGLLSWFQLQFYTCLIDNQLRESFHSRLDIWTSKK